MTNHINPPPLFFSSPLFYTATEGVGSNFSFPHLVFLFHPHLPIFVWVQRNISVSFLRELRGGCKTAGKSRAQLLSAAAFIFVRPLIGARDTDSPAMGSPLESEVSVWEEVLRGKWAVTCHSTPMECVVPGVLCGLQSYGEHGGLTSRGWSQELHLQRMSPNSPDSNGVVGSTTAPWRRVCWGPQSSQALPGKTVKESRPVICSLCYLASPEGAHTQVAFNCLSCWWPWLPSPLGQALFTVQIGEWSSLSPFLPFFFAFETEAEWTSCSWDTG